MQELNTSRAKLGGRLPLAMRSQEGFENPALHPAGPTYSSLTVNESKKFNRYKQSRKAICCDWKTLKEMECFIDDLIF